MSVAPPTATGGPGAMAAAGGAQPTSRRATTPLRPLGDTRRTLSQPTSPARTSEHPVLADQPAYRLALDQQRGEALLDLAAEATALLEVRILARLG